MIISTSDSVFSLNTGIVVSVLNLGQEYAVIIQSDNDLFYTYVNLKQGLFKKGDSISKTQWLGNLHQTDDLSYTLQLLITTPKGNHLSENDIVERLKNFQQECNDVIL